MLLLTLLFQLLFLFLLEFGVMALSYLFTIFLLRLTILCVFFVYLVVRRE